jgi:hypothetical protein
MLKIHHCSLFSLFSSFFFQFQAAKPPAKRQPSGLLHGGHVQTIRSHLARDGGRGCHEEDGLALCLGMPAGCSGEKLWQKWGIELVETRHISGI